MLKKSRSSGYPTYPIKRKPEKTKRKIRGFKSFVLALILVCFFSFSTFAGEFPLVVQQFRQFINSLIQQYSLKDYAPQLEAIRLEVEELIRNTVASLVEELNLNSDQLENQFIQEFTDKIWEDADDIILILESDKEEGLRQLEATIREKIEAEYNRQKIILENTSNEQLELITPEVQQSTNETETETEITTEDVTEIN